MQFAVTPLVSELTRPLHRELEGSEPEPDLQPERALHSELINTLRPADPRRLVHDAPESSDSL